MAIARDMSPIWRKVWISPANLAHTTEAAARLAIVLCLLSVTAFCVWALDRGFDITDEAYYLLLALYPDSVRLYLSAQQWVTGGIWQVTGSLVTFRAAGMFLVATGAGVLALGVSCVLTRGGIELASTGRNRQLLFTCSVTSALVYVETINFSPSYNLLASAGAYAAAGMVLLALGGNGANWRWMLLVLAGGALGVELVSKPSAGAATFGVLALWIWIMSPALWRKVAGVALVSTGIVSCVAGLLLTHTTIKAARLDVSEGLALFSLVQSEFVGDRLLRYLVEYFQHAAHAFKENLLLLVSVVVYLVTRRPIFILMTIAIVLYTLGFSEYHLGYTGKYELHFVSQMELGFVLLVLILLVSFPAWQNSPQFIALLGGLILLPYSVGIGTGNSIFTQVLATLAPWGVAIAAIANLRLHRNPDRLLVLALVAGFMMSFSLQTVTGVFRAPYHLVYPLILQQHPITIGPLGSVKVDFETHDFVTALERAADRCGILPGSPFLGLYNIPGVALVLQAVPPVTPWLNNLAQAEVVLQRMPPEAVHSSLVGLLLDANGDRPAVPAALGSMEADFRYCGTSTFPLLGQQVQIWRPQSPVRSVPDSLRNAPQ